MTQAGVTWRKAHAVHPITAVQNGYALWTRNPEIARLATCRELFAPNRVIAHAVGCTPAQSAMAWLLHRGEHILTIPGMRSVDHLVDNLGAASVRLSPAVVQQLDDPINHHTVAGNREVDRRILNLWHSTPG